MFTFKKGRDSCLTMRHFLGRVLVLEFAIWERFTGFGTNIHPCTEPVARTPIGVSAKSPSNISPSPSEVTQGDPKLMIPK